MLFNVASLELRFIFSKHLIHSKLLKHIIHIYYFEKHGCRGQVGKKVGLRIVSKAALNRIKKKEKTSKKKKVK